jgi:hypothetical protein
MMKIRIAVVFLSLAASALAEPAWFSKLSSTAPGPFPPPRPLDATYSFGWSGFTAGEGKASFRHGKGDLLRLDMRGRTTGIVRAMWRLDATHTAETHSSNLRPMRVQQTEAYRGKTITTKLAFSSEGVARTRSEKPPQKDDNKTKKFKVRGLFDMHTALLFVRSQKLTPGETFTFVVYPATSGYLAKVKVVDRESIKIAGKKRRAIKLDLQLQKISDKLALERHEKFKSATAWLSDDEDRILLRAEAEIFVGSVWVELESVKFEP